MLIQGLKFDIRVYVLVTSFDPLRAYIYREGLARFASSVFSTEEEDLRDPFKHLTNYSVNRYYQRLPLNSKNSTEQFICSVGFLKY